MDFDECYFDPDDEPSQKASISSVRVTRSGKSSWNKNNATKKREKSRKKSVPHGVKHGKDSDSDEFKLDDEDITSESDANSDWEDVTTECEPLAKKKKNYQPIQVTVSSKSGSKKSKLEQAMDEIRRRINRKLLISQYDVHKVHLLCLISLGCRASSIASNNFFKGSLLSCIPLKIMSKITKKSFDSNCLNEVRDWFLKAFPVQLQSDYQGGIRLKSMADFLMLRRNRQLSEMEYILMFVSLCRSLGLNARIIFSLQPTSYKATDTLPSRPLSKAFLDRMNLKCPEGKHTDGAAVKSELKGSIDTFCKEIKVDGKPKTKRKSKAGKRSKSSDVEDQVDRIKEEDDDDDDDDEEESKKCRKRKVAKREDKVKSSSQVKGSAKMQKGRARDTCDWWAEVYIKSASSWITVAGPSLDIKKIDEVEKRLTKPISYILAFDSENHVKDLTRKYDSNWLKTTSKMRLDEGWWSELLKHFSDDISDESLEEDLQIHDALLRKPFPTSIAEYKNHPLYALQRHLLRYEAIYPSTAAILGRLKTDEPIYARECIHTLCSREKWLIEGRMILPDQEPYKFVKALPKSGKQRIETDQMLGLYGSWQTELYIGPQAVNGIVPKNKYGNVDLFKPWMLPQGTVHLKGTYYGMGKAARKAGIDAAPAMTGWEFHKGLNHPILNGWVVCKENADALLEAWKEEQNLGKEKEKEKREKRVAANWKKLVKHLLIRNKLRKSIMSIDDAKRKMSSCKSKVKNLDSDSESCSSFLTVSELSEQNSNYKKTEK